MDHEQIDSMEKPERKRKIFVDALAILFGISSWIGVTSSYLQLPLIVPTAPEGWSLPSYMVISVQSANIVSFAYVLYQKYAPKKVDDGLLIYITLFIGCVAAIGMAIFYKETTDINGTKHSVALLIFCFMLAVVGCLSSVLFMPYMGRFRECYLVSYMLGMFLNGFLSSIMALIQGAGDECVPNDDPNGPDLIKRITPPLFGIDIYFAMVSVILVCCTFAFVLLNNLKICLDEYAAGTIGIGNNYSYDKKSGSEEQNQNLPEDVVHLSTCNYIFLLMAVFGLSGFGNGVLPGIMTYTCLPYGKVTYHISAALNAIAQPCAGLVAMFLQHTSILVIRILSFVGTILAVYIFFIRTQSPSPPLQDLVIGDIIIASSWFIFTFIISYMKLSIVSIFRYQEGRSLVWVGTVNQVSAVVGAVISFVLVNQTKIFVSYEPCE